MVPSISCGHVFSFTLCRPYGKIPDREDFRKMDYATRVAYWETVISESRRLADDFAALVDNQRVAEHLQAFDTGKDN